MNSTDQHCNYEAPAQISLPKPHGETKKQVRRRRQSRRLYKDMPLDMAEARREIVTALKLHRSTKEAREQQQKQDQQIKQSLPPFPQLCSCFGAEGRRKSRRNHRIYPGCSYDCSFYLENGYGFVAPPPVAQNLNTDVPIRTLDLNLNFDDDIKIADTSYSFYSLSFWPPSSDMCPTVSCPATHQEVPESISLCEEERKLMASDMFSSNNDPTGESEKDMKDGAVEEETMANMRFMSMDVKPVDGHHSFDNAMEFPDWLSINDDFLQQHLNYDCVAEDYLQDPDLSCFEIGKIEDMDGGWLA